MIRIRSVRPIVAALAACVVAGWAPAPAGAHFLWITAEPPREAGQPATIRVFLNEEPEPGGPEFLKYVQGVVPTAAGVPLATTIGATAVTAAWAGPLPATVDAERDLGLKARGDLTYRLSYTARLQAAPVAEAVAERGTKLRARAIMPKGQEGKPVVQVLYDGKPAPRAKIKTYPATGAGADLVADADGRAEVAGVVEGTTGLWATWTDPTPGQLDGKSFAETRYYATLHFPAPAPAETPAATTFATMPEPAVNSFGGAILGDWLYAYGGHVGQTHQYSTETTAKHFRRLSLRDRTTWEDLPMGRDGQGLALVADGRYLYRVGGMNARNAPGQPQEMVSAPDFARFDPESKTWTDLAPLPVARSTHDAAVVGRRVYAVGGWTMKGSQESPVFLDDAVAFDLDHPDQGWKSFPQPFRRRALAAAEAGGKLYVVGGLTDENAVSRRVDVFDPATAAWSTGPEIPGADRDGFAASAIAVDGRLVVNGASGMITRLDPARGVWEALGAWSLPRITHRILAGPDHTLFVVGGNHRGIQTPVVEVVTIPPPDVAPATR